MPDKFDSKIRQKAHELWEADGHPHGQDVDHWVKARDLVQSEQSLNREVDLEGKESFDECWYLGFYLDVKAAVLSGVVESGYKHFINNGKSEGRLPNGKSKLASS